MSLKKDNFIFNFNFDKEMYIQKIFNNDNCIIGNYDETRRRMAGLGLTACSSDGQKEEIDENEEVIFLNLNNGLEEVGEGSSQDEVSGSGTKSDYVILAKKNKFLESNNIVNSSASIPVEAVEQVICEKVNVSWWKSFPLIL
jgi:hypothetical protein